MNVMTTVRRLVRLVGPGRDSDRAARRPTRMNGLVAGLAGFGVGIATLTAVAAVPATTPGVPEVNPADVVDGIDLRRGFVGIAEAVVPGVVRIETRRESELASRAFPALPPGLGLFFDEGRRRPSAPQVSGGTGFVVSGDGYVLTNHHVVDDADEITVWLHDGRSFEGTLIGSDPTTDVAVIDIDADALPVLSLADSDELRVGEWVVAIGNPGFVSGQALDETVTAGIVSAIGRPLAVIRGGLSEDPESREMAQWAIEDFIQTDAVINPGNSGGPLVNLDGQVVGMNTAIMSTSGYYQGYGFSIPINLVQGVMDDLIEYGGIRRAWLGVQISEVTAEDAEAFDLPSISGVLVQGVTVEGPADEGGLQVGDVIVGFDGVEAGRPGALQQRVARADPGQRVSIDIIREGEERTMRVRLGESPLDDAPRVVRAGSSRLDNDLLGLRLEADQDQYGGEGVFVTAVDPAGPAARKGVRRGARLESVNGESVRSRADLSRALSEIEGGEVVSLVFEDEGGATRIANVRARVPEGGER